MLCFLWDCFGIGRKQIKYTKTHHVLLTMRVSYLTDLLPLTHEKQNTTKSSWDAVVDLVSEGCFYVSSKRNYNNNNSTPPLQV